MIFIDYVITRATKLLYTIMYHVHVIGHTISTKYSNYIIPDATRTYYTIYGNNIPFIK